MENKKIILEYSKICKDKNSLVTSFVNSLPKEVIDSNAFKKFMSGYGSTTHSEACLVRELLDSRQVVVKYDRNIA